METLLNILAGILGILLYQLVKSKEYIKSASFSVEVVVSQNLKVWLWALAMCITVASILFIEPNANNVIKMVSGLDLNNTRIGWLLFGAGLCGAIRNSQSPVNQDSDGA